MFEAETPEELSGPEDELRGQRRKISLSRCGACGSEEAKYRCPGCLANSCSLLCVKKHKEDSGCSGVRNKTAFVKLTEFDEMALLSDYRFLEDTGRFADSSNRDRLIRTPRSTVKAKKLAASARKINITLRFLPVTFTKSRENSTFFLSKERLFLWHVKLLFPQSGAEFSQRRVCEKKTLEQILTPYVHPTESDPVTRQKLKMYVHAPFDHIKVFMKAEGRKANSVRYHELDVHKSLRDNLSYKTLIEYPVLHVVLRDHWDDFPLKGPAAACSTSTKELDHERKDVGQVSSSTAKAKTPQGTNIRKTTPETSPEDEPPKQKRAKREAKEEEEDLEEGEIPDSSDEEEDSDTENSSSGGNKLPVEAKDGPADRVDTNADDSLAKHRDSRTDPGMKMDASSPNDDKAAVRESAEVGMTKEVAVKELEPVHSPSLSG